uniref:Uncharacterized protein n=1 Tax=Physcomitrium patens TaxID=3218 RepID=A0A2K1IG63_PHYPA|nr:hypothetical protein PHYPA_028849 [Physcomitrium patens]
MPPHLPVHHSTPNSSSQPSAPTAPTPRKTKLLKPPYCSEVHVSVILMVLLSSQHS